MKELASNKDDNSIYHAFYLEEAKYDYRYEMLTLEK